MIKAKNQEGRIGDVEVAVKKVGSACLGLITYRKAILGNFSPYLVQIAT